MDAPRSGVSAAVLAGGKSRRMGRDKAWIDLGDGRPLIRRVLEEAAAVADDVSIVANDERYAELGLPLVHDRYPGTGALGGIATAIEAAARDRVIVLACDMPFVRRGALRLLVELSEGYDAVVPHIRGELHPLHALYARRAVAAIRRAINAGRLRVTDVLAQLSVRALGEAELRVADPELVSVTNINTPEELAAVVKLFSVPDPRKG
jgi:molybdenum cofactor guanylyltransferase